MKRTLLILAFLFAVIVTNAQKSTERELILECTSKFLLFHGSGKNIQALYLYDVSNSEEKKLKEVSNLEKILPLITKSVSDLKNSYPNSSKNKTFKTDLDAAKKFLEAVKESDWKSENSSMTWQMILSLLGMDLEEIALNVGNKKG